MKRHLTIIAIIAASIASAVPGMAADRGIGGLWNTRYSSADFAAEDERVRSVQKALTRAGYYHYAVDGFWGLTTQGAVEEYQKENNLPVTGTIDATLLRSLDLPY
jgi:peptidoglycan hydrolase-like protein with peptidoglycan-binding domain